MNSRRVANSIALATLLTAFIPSSAMAAPNLQDVRDKVRILQQDASAAAEAAQQAQVDLNRLTSQLASVKRQADAEAKTVSTFQNSLGAIAREQYKTGGMSQSMELLFSSDPKLFLSAAGSLDAVTKRQSLQLRRYSVAKQRLNATSLTVNDKVALATKAKARYEAQKAAANDKLAQAQKLLASLTKAEQARLAKLNDDAENADQAASLAEAARLNLGSGRGAMALRFALKQIGDRYVFGAAGMVYWDCSGLTMRAFATAGVSLPHSAAAQMSYGKSVPYDKLKPGDLVFFGRRRYVSHVGIYLGNGRMVDAPHSGSRVKIENFGRTFGSEVFYGARRI
jgi:cell wall-associated NlpC family hydrolase